MALTISSFSSPIGFLRLAATEKGLCSLSLDVSEKEFIAHGKKSFNAEPVRDADSPILRLTEKELKEYFEGRLKRFTVPIDWSAMSPFQIRVLTELFLIPYGETASYGQIAACIGKPKASRAVGTAVARNPIPIIIPCHRVIPADGSLGGYLWGPKIKRRLQEIESAIS